MITSGELLPFGTVERTDAIWPIADIASKKSSVGCIQSLLSHPHRKTWRKPAGLERSGMRMKLLAAVAAATAAMAPVPVSAQSSTNYVAPRTSFGHPSLEGVWTANFILPIEASTPSALVLSEEQAKQAFDRMMAGYVNQPRFALDPEVHEAPRLLDGFARVRGERRSRALVEPADGKLPLTADARSELSRRGEVLADNPEERGLAERCISLSPAPNATVLPINPRLFVQTASHVVIYNEYGHEARIIPLSMEHDNRGTPSRAGNSIAHWEGETLIVETVGLVASPRVLNDPRIVVGANSKVIERFTRITADELLVEFTVEDTSIYVVPWRAELSLYRTDVRQFEFACHEGNYGLPNILRGQRVMDERAARPERR
jgi:hypothetical protein